MLEDELNRIVDDSEDHLYFTIVPRYIWAVARDPYDFMLWSVIKDIAGEKGECFLSTPQLATLAMMSEGKVQDCRAYLIQKGVLTGEVRQDPGYPYPVWHLSIPNVWEKNLLWAKHHITINSRIEYKHSDSPAHHTSIKKHCSRCGREFVPSGRRSHRCESCQQAAREEQMLIHSLFGSIKGKLIKENTTCQECGSSEQLELHLVETAEQGKVARRVVVLCANCHNQKHRQLSSPPDTPPSPTHSSDESIFSDPLSHSSDERNQPANQDHSWDEDSIPPDESGDSPGENTPPSDETKKNQLKSKQNNQKKKDSEGLSLPDAHKVWEMVLGMLRLEISKSAFQTWVDSAKITGWEGATLRVAVGNEYTREWLAQRLASTVRRHLAGITNCSTADVYFYVDRLD
ncbi:MAG: hypothetical protein M1281_09740 [Chloroflexi bacterium]|nr:hypothetical protein [Chloroflexota bacterium]